MAKRKKFRFSPIKHLPSYSILFMEAVTNPLVLYIIIVGNVILICSVGIFYKFEFGVNPHVKSVFDALWWGMATITTVGYGDVVPVTVGGKFISFFLMVAGIVFFVGWSAIVMSIFLRHAEEDIFQSERLSIIEYEVISQKLEEISARLKYSSLRPYLTSHNQYSDT